MNSEPLDLRAAEARLERNRKWCNCAPLAELARDEAEILAALRETRAEAERLRDALHPFYAYACLEDDLSSGHSAPDVIAVVETTRGGIHAAVTVGSFRKARIAYERALAVLAKVRDE